MEGEVKRGKDRSFGRAIGHIVIADLSMSLDNSPGRGGRRARPQGHPRRWPSDLGRADGGLRPYLIARLLGRYPIIAWLGLAVIVLVAIEMIWQGSTQVACAGIFPAFCDMAT